MTPGLIALAVAVGAIVLAIAGRMRAVTLLKRLQAAGEPPVDLATGMVATHVARLRLAPENDKAARLEVPLHVAVADIRGGDRAAADLHGSQLNVELHPSTVGVRAGASRFVLLSMVSDPTAGIALDQSVWGIHRYVISPGDDATALLDLIEESAAP